MRLLRQALATLRRLPRAEAAEETVHRPSSAVRLARRTTLLASTLVLLLDQSHSAEQHIFDLKCTPHRLLALIVDLRMQMSGLSRVLHQPFQGVSTSSTV